MKMEGGESQSRENRSFFAASSKGGGRDHEAGNVGHCYSWKGEDNNSF